MGKKPAETETTQQVQEKQTGQKFSYKLLKERVDEFSSLNPVTGVNAVDKIITLNYSENLSTEKVRSIAEDILKEFGTQYKGWRVTIIVQERKYVTLL